MVGSYALGERVFAKVKGYPPWPARIDSVEDSVKPAKQKYSVFFYGTHEIAFLSPKNIYPYDKFKDKYDKPNNKQTFNRGLWEILNHPDVVFSPETSVTNVKRQKRKREEDDVPQPASKLRQVDSEVSCKRRSSTSRTPNMASSLDYKSCRKDKRKKLFVNDSNATTGNKGYEVESKGKGIKVEKNLNQQRKSRRSGHDEDNAKEAEVKEPNEHNIMSRVFRVAVRRHNHNPQEGSESAGKTNKSSSSNNLMSTPSISRSVENVFEVKSVAEGGGRRMKRGQLQALIPESLKQIKMKERSVKNADIVENPDVIAGSRRKRSQLQSPSPQLTVKDRSVKNAVKVENLDVNAGSRKTRSQLQTPSPQSLTQSTVKDRSSESIPGAEMPVMVTEIITVGHKSQESVSEHKRKTSSSPGRSVKNAVKVENPDVIAGSRRKRSQLQTPSPQSLTKSTVKDRSGESIPDAEMPVMVTEIITVGHKSQESLSEHKRKTSSSPGSASTVAVEKGKKGRPKKKTASCLKQKKRKLKGRSCVRKDSVRPRQNISHIQKHANLRLQKMTLLEAVKNGDVLAVSDFLGAAKQIVHHTKNVYNEALILASQLGHKRIIQLLLHRGAHIDVNDCKYGTPLIAAVRNGYLDIVKFLLTAGANVSIENVSGETALMFAVENAHSTQIVESLISYGAKVNSQNKHGRTPALASVQKCDFDMLKLLIDLDADLCISDVTGNTGLTMASDKHCLDLVQLLLESKESHVSPLERAVARNSVDMVRILLDCNFVNESKSVWSRSILAKALGKGCLECHAKDTTNPEIIRLLVKKGAHLHGEYDGNLPLNLAAASGSLELVQLLLDAGADVNVSDRRNNMTPLMHVAKHGHIDVLTCLLDIGACVNIIADFEVTALTHALKHGNIECARILLEKWARINIKHDLYICVEFNQYESLKLVLEHVDVKDLDSELLFVAVQDGFCEVAELLIDHGMNVNAIQVPSGETVLMQASTIEMAEMLLRKGADVNMTVCKYGTPLIHFSSYDADVTTRDNIVDVLIRNGANVNSLDEYGCNALIKAALHEREGAVHLLITARADVNQANDQGQTALMMAAQRCNTNIINMLLTNGALVNEQTSKDKQTALMFACMNSYIHVAQLLLDKGAIVDLEDDSGNTALLLTTDEDVLDLLVSRGADVNKQNKNGKTCLIFAACSKNLSMVKKLIYLGADVCLVNEVEKETALSSVIQAVVLKAKEYNCIEALLEAGAAKVCPLHCDVTLTRLIIDNKRWLVQMCVTNGAVPSSICIQCLSRYNCFNKRFCARIEESISELSPLAVALICGNTDIASYLASNWFLAKSDLVVGDSSSLDKVRPLLQELLRYESLSFLDIFCVQPSSLAKLSFVAVSDLLGPATGREARIHISGLPLLLQLKLLFRDELVPLQDNTLETHGLSLKVIDLLPHHYSPSPSEEYLSSSDFDLFG